MQTRIVLNSLAGNFDSLSFLSENWKCNLNPVKSSPPCAMYHQCSALCSAKLAPTSVPSKLAFPHWLHSQLPTWGVLFAVLYKCVSVSVKCRCWFKSVGFEFYSFAVETIQPKHVSTHEEDKRQLTPWPQCTMRGEEKLFSLGSWGEIRLTLHWIPRYSFQHSFIYNILFFSRQKLNRQLLLGKVAEIRRPLSGLLPSPSLFLVQFITVFLNRKTINRWQYV